MIDERSDAVGEVPVSSLVVLGLVSLGARSGYEVKKAVDLSIRYFWNLSPAQIYPSLRLLETRGLIVGTDDPRGRRPRRVYDITLAGRGELERWLGREEEMPFELRDLGMLKLFFGDSLRASGAGDLTELVMRRSRERVEALRAIRPTAQALADLGSPMPLLTVDLGVACHLAMEQVCREHLRATFPDRVDDRD